MPVLLVILFMPLIVILWTLRYLIHYHDRKTEERLRAAIEKAAWDAQVARPLKDYVAGLRPQPVKKSALCYHIPGQSPPTLGNIGRFAALSIRSRGDLYFVRGQDGTVYGPADEATLRQWILEERIAPDTPASNHKDGPWLPAHQVHALQDVFYSVFRRAELSDRFEKIQISGKQDL